MLWLFNLDNILLLRGNVEGSYGQLSLGLDYILYTTRCFFVGYRLIVQNLGGYSRELAVFFAPVCIELL